MNKSRVFRMSRRGTAKWMFIGATFVVLLFVLLMLLPG